jgi:hypothetical protein
LQGVCGQSDARSRVNALSMEKKAARKDQRRFLPILLIWQMMSQTNFLSG